jgi:hypothetical protein
VKAVEIPDCPELAKYTDVIVMSVDPNCPRSLASYLGGGGTLLMHPYFVQES